MIRNNSFWLNSFKKDSYNKLDTNVSVDICIVGGGLTGITTAYYLSKYGYKIALLEKNTLLSKTSGHTTAKVTSQHGLIYNYLENSNGLDFAKNYLQANETAIGNIKKIIELENIDCDFERKNAYVFTENKENEIKIIDEFNTVKKLEIVDCNLINNVNLNLNITSTLVFKNQAQFNPIKYGNALAKCANDNNCLIFENTKFEDYKKEGNNFKIFTNTHNCISSNYLILATRYPIINFPGYYFVKMYQEISYVIAIKPKSNFSLDGMYISCDTPNISIKTANYKGENIIFVGGHTYKTGIDPDLNYKYDFLKRKAFEIFGEFDLLYEWNTQDCISLDKIPYIGEFSAFTNNLFLATGFNKWGMTTSNIAASIISDKINKVPNKYEFLFKSTRLHPIKNRKELNNMAVQTFKSLVLDRLKKSKLTIDSINNDEGKIVTLDNKKIGVYKDNDGKVYAVKPICTHLGCQLNWNNLNKTWDCPCHGSRFDYMGNNIYSPGINNLECYSFK